MTNMICKLPEYTSVNNISITCHLRNVSDFHQSLNICFYVDQMNLSHFCSTVWIYLGALSIVPLFVGVHHIVLHVTTQQARQVVPISYSKCSRIFSVSFIQYHFQVSHDNCVMGFGDMYGSGYTQTQPFHFIITVCRC